MTIEQVTQAKQGDTLDLAVQVVDVKASDHKWFGPHDLVTLELTAAAGDLPAGLRFQLRRPHDGSNDLRSEARKEVKQRADEAALPIPTPDMTRDELLAIADARGIDAGAKPTKAALLKLLSA